MQASVQTPWLSDYDLYLFGEGTHLRAYEKLGAHQGEVEGRRGVHFAVWAPNAERVTVIGEHNGWNPEAHPMQLRPAAGMWETFVPDIGPGALYKYHIVSRQNRSEEHTSELQSPCNIVCRLLLEKKHALDIKHWRENVGPCRSCVHCGGSVMWR